MFREYLHPEFEACEHGSVFQQDNASILYKTPQVLAFLAEIIIPTFECPPKSRSITYREHLKCYEDEN